jgi:hypothetical protein
VQCGIGEVISPPPGETEPWASDAAFSIKMLTEASIVITYCEVQT